MKPLYKHDCDRCVYLGTAAREYSPGRLLDWYACPQGGDPTYVRRYSDEPSDYGSADTFGMELYLALGEEANTRAYYLMRHWRKHYDRRERMKMKRTIARRERRAHKRFDRDFGDLFDI